MTLPGGGRSAAVGAGAIMLTEYAPVTVINLSTTLRIWVADNSGVGPQNGVPVDPGTSLPWRQDGELWAVIDPSAAPGSTVTTVITGAVDIWQPSPAAIAAQTALALLAQGVPNVLLTAILEKAVPVASNQYLSVPGVSQYGSAVVQIKSNATNLGFKASIQQAVAGIVASYEYLTCPVITGLTIPPSGTWAVPLIGDALLIQNMDATNPITVTVAASNRSIPAIVQVGRTLLPRIFVASNVAVTNGIEKPIPANDGDVATTTFNGSVSVRAVATLAGVFQYHMVRGDPTGGVVEEVAPFVEFTAADISAGTTSKTVTVAHPKCVCYISFLPTATGTGTFAVTMTPSVS